MNIFSACMSLIWSNMSLTSSMLYAVTSLSLSLYRKISDTRPQSPITYLQIHKGGWRQGRSPLNPAAPLEGAVRLWSREPMKDVKDMKDEDIKVIYIKVVLAHYRGCFPCRQCPAQRRRAWLLSGCSASLGGYVGSCWAIFLMFF